MTDMATQCSCVVDTDGLHNIANASANLKGILLEHLKNGNIGVPVPAWQEFEDLYEDEAAELKGFITNRIVMKQVYYVGAARIADTLNSGFPRGAYDDNVELLTASVASINGYLILTSTSQVTAYEKMSCNASEVEVWVEGLDAA